MNSKTTRLDRFIARKMDEISKKDVKLLLAKKQILVNGIVATKGNQVIDEFSHIVLNGKILQNKSPVYIMMNKPKGVVSATKDVVHKTVVDLLDEPNKQDLHIVGRLDFNTTGLLLLTNDSRWSRALMHADNKVNKVYKVIVEKPLTDAYSQAFLDGMYFEYEDITTLPVKLRIISDYQAEVTLQEGRYHQIKRMFARFENKVLELHRISIGNLQLDDDLDFGQYRELSLSEINSAS